MTSFAWSSLLGASAVLALAGGCQSCFERARTYTLSDAEVALVTDDGETPIAARCDSVCYQHDRGEAPISDGDGGLVFVPSPHRVVGCTLAGHELTCDFGRVCAV
jgi:hypothetical protein